MCVLAAALPLPGCALDGEAIFEREGCLECHRYQGRGGYLGPDLNAVTARRSPEWIRQQLRNAKKNNVPFTSVSSEGLHSGLI